MRYKKKWMAFLAAVLVFTGLQITGPDVHAASAVTTPAYTAELHEDQTITAGKTVTLTVEMGPDTAKFNSLNIKVSYDSDYLSFEKDLSSGVSNCAFTEVTGGVDVARYGAEIDLAANRQICKLVFRARKAGNTTVSITSMNADLDANAATGDAPDVTVTQKDAVLTIKPAPQTDQGSGSGSGKHHHKGGSSSDSTPASSGTEASTPASGVASPQTGDTAMPVLWGVLIVAAAAAIVLLLHKRKQYLHK